MSSPYEISLKYEPTDSELGYLRVSGYHTSLGGSTGVYLDTWHQEEFQLDSSDDGASSLESSVHKIVVSENSKATDWNAEYQALLEKKLPSASPEDELSRIQALRDLYEQFARTAAAIGTTIISERYLSPENRSLEVSTRLGVAGGEKYIHAPQRLFFKLCVNTRGIYGSDEAASKAAGNEMRGIMEYMDARVSGIRYPLVVLIDFLGYRLMAQSILPITKGTLVYGSADGGRTVRSADPLVNEKMRQCAENINLTTHWMYNLRKTSKHRLSSCVDIEVHRGTDQRLYLIDAARALPCTKPVPGIKGGNLYRLFRPEFVRKYARPLCPDAYGGWPLEDRAGYEQEIDQATRVLFGEVIPAFARELDQRLGPGNAEVPLAVICQDAHRAGINMRYLGLVRASCTNEIARTLLLTEILARTLKQVIRGRMRKVKSDDIELYKAVVVNIINSLLVNEDEAFWCVSVKRSMLKRFASAVTVQEAENQQLDLRKLVLPGRLFFRITSFLSMSFTVHSALLVLRMFYGPLLKDLQLPLEKPENLWVTWSSIAPGNRERVKFVPGDIVSMIPRVKTLHVIPFEEGTALAKMASELQDGAERTDDAFKLAYERYKQNLVIKPGDLRALHNWGISNTLHGLALLAKRGPADGPAAEGAEGDIEASTTLFHKAIGKFRTCISINSTDWIALYLWGNTLLSWFIGVYVNQLENPIGGRDLLLNARGKYQEAWLMCVGSFNGENEEIPPKVQELLYAWGNTFLYEVIYCKREEPELLRLGCSKYEQALRGEDHATAGEIVAESLQYRLRFNLGVALSRLDRYSQCSEVFQELVWRTERCPFQLFFNWGNSVLRHVRTVWGSLGQRNAKPLEREVLLGLQMYVRSMEASKGSYPGVLSNWGSLLFLWSEIRFKLYGTHKSKERAGAKNSLGTPIVRRSREPIRYSSTSTAHTATTTLQSMSQMQQDSENATEDFDTTEESITATATEPSLSDSEEDEPESSTESSEESYDEDEAGYLAGVSEDVYVFSVDFFLQSFLCCYLRGGHSKPRLDSLVTLGASKDLILSAHTIGAILSITSSANALECESVLSAIRSRGGHGKLKMDPEFNMYLPSVVTSTIQESLMGAGGIVADVRAAISSAQQRSQLPSSSVAGQQHAKISEVTTIVAEQELGSLFHGNTVVN